VTPLPWCTAALFALGLAGQGTPQAAIAESAAWDALASGRSAAAAEAFRQALESDPTNARSWLGAGMAAALERRDDAARTALERALALDPRLTRARALLGQVLRRSGDLTGAIRTYEQLLAEAPDDREIQATVERWRREADLRDRMDQTVDAHFTVKFEGPAQAELATRALESLDRAYWRIGQLLETFPVDPIPVVLYTTEQFRDITRSPSWAAGAYDGTIRVPIRGALDHPDELDRVLAHEFAHALIRSLAARNVPAWLNEGLATALESPDLSWAETRVASSPPVPLHVLQRGFGNLSGGAAALAYATSAIAARRLLQTAGGYAVANLLRDLGSGADFRAAFLHRVNRSFDDFERDVSVY